MRELLYVSRAKLDRFFNERRASRIPAVFNTLELSFTSLFKVSVSRVGSPSNAISLEILMKRIDQVIKDVEYSGEPARWWNEDNVKIGDWIQFDTRQKYVNTSSLFLAWSSEASGEDSQSGSILLLHGSARHVVGSVQFWETPRFGESRRIGGMAGGSEPQLPITVKEELAPFLRWKTGRRSFPGPWPTVKVRLRGLKSLAVEFHLRRRDDLAALMSMLLDQGEGTVDSGDLAGFARVTSVYDIGDIYSGSSQVSTDSRLITATPLYVERL